MQGSDKEADMRKLTALSVTLVLLLSSMPAATAHGASLMRAELEGGSRPIFEPEAVGARCPAGFEWILQTFGSGEITTDIYAGGFTFSGEHCSRWLAGPPESPDRQFFGRVGGGELTLTTPEGDLVLSYGGGFAFQGDVTIPEFTSRLLLRYRVEGGDSTGIFEGASGRGLLLGRDQTGAQSVRLVGWLSSRD